MVTDLHSNLPALEAVLADMGPVDALWCLGDLVGYGPWPNEVIEVLRGRGARCIAGNHDLGSIDAVSTEEFSPDAGLAAVWTASELSSESRAFLESLTPYTEVDGVTLAHGTPCEPVWEYLLGEDTAAASFSCFSTQLCLVGHTHIPSLFVEQCDDEIAIGYMEAGRTFACSSLRCIANPGSVGQPRDRDPRAAYLLLERPETPSPPSAEGASSPAGPILEWRRVPYDIAAVQEEMQRVGLPVFLSERIALGV